MLGDVREGLRRHEVGGCLDLGPETLELGIDRDRYRRLAGEGAERDREAALREDPGVNSTGEVAELLHGDLHLFGGSGEEPLDIVVGAPAEPPLRAFQLQGERHEALLGAVVEIALDPSPLLVRGCDEPRARILHHGQLRLDLRVQPPILEREAGCRAGGVQ